MKRLFEIMLELAENVENKSTFYYTALVLLPEDRAKLYERFKDQIPTGWKSPAESDRLAHHMTINTGRPEDGPAANWVGMSAPVKVVSVAMDDKTMAVGVETGVPSKNPNKHITIAISPEGTAKDSNNLTNWQKIEPLLLHGIIEMAQVELDQTPSTRVSRPPSAAASDDPVMFVQNMKQAGKPIQVIKMAMKGKFPHLSPEEIEAFARS